MPARRPSWARLRDDNALAGAVEVSQLEEDRWVMTATVARTSSVEDMLNELTSTGCARGFTYKVVGVAVCVEKVMDNDSGPTGR